MAPRCRQPDVCPDPRPGPHAGVLQTVGATCLGTAYVTANQVPDLLYDLILGGALTSAMVPVLARPAERAAGHPAEKARVGDIPSAS